jgi:maleate isomerase
MNAVAAPPARVLLGMLTPSSNTTLEPVTTSMVATLPEVSAHFGRFRVTEIALSGQALGQFDDSEILRAAELLAHARPAVIGWSGTSAGWLGFDADARLCRQITLATGVPACTSVLALNEIFARTGVRRFGLVTPYLDDVQAAIIGNYAGSGFSCCAERHLQLRDNFSFSEVGADVLRALVRDVARSAPDAITILCTNLRGAPLVEELEAETGIPIYDSVATVVWKSLQLAGADTTRIAGWGRLFRDL